MVSQDLQFDINGPPNLSKMAPVFGIEDIISGRCPRYTRDCHRLIKPTAVTNIDDSFHPKAHSHVLILSKDVHKIQHI